MTTPGFLAIFVSLPVCDLLAKAKTDENNEKGPVSLEKQALLCA
jgi:hypothetical protein